MKTLLPRFCIRTGIANKRKGPITSLRSDTSLRRTHVLTSPHLNGCVFQSLSTCLPRPPFSIMVMEVVTRPTDDDYCQVSLVPPFRIHRRYSLARTNRSRKPEDIVPDCEGPTTMSGSRVDTILFCPDQGSRIMTAGLSLCICACSVRVDELRKYRSHFSTQDLSLIHI